MRTVINLRFFFGKLQKLGIDTRNINALKSISEYAITSAIDNDYDEVYNEYRTKRLLGGD